MPGKKHILLFVALFTILLLTACSSIRQTRIDQAHIEKERKKKERVARKQYMMELKRHYKNQTKETRKRMKQTRRESKRVTPGMK
jgi:outer membrane biogenesis lipoprotein LolB